MHVSQEGHTPIYFYCFKFFLQDMYKIGFLLGTVPGLPCQIGFITSNGCACVRSVMSDSFRPHGPHSSPSSSALGIFQERILEQVAISVGKISPTHGLNPYILRLLHWPANSLPLHHLGSPTFLI